MTASAEETSPVEGHEDKPPSPAEIETISQAVKDASTPPEEQDEQDDDRPQVEEPAKEEEDDQGAYYWDASTMAPLNASSAPSIPSPCLHTASHITPNRAKMNRILMRSKAAIARLRAYRPPEFPVWDKLHVSRRAAVLILLYADRRGDLRVVVTMRAASLRSFSGHAAFPGGKADTAEESPYQIARREAWEEIGLPMDDSKIPKPFRIEHLCYLPCSLARTELVVRPCVALLHSDDSPASKTPAPTVEETLIPKLDAKEVAAVFSAPFHNFLKAADELLPGQDPKELPPGAWYEGSWTKWHNEPWRLHYFYVPVNNQKVTKPKVREGGLAAIAEQLEEEEQEVGRYMVWGMTGRMLVDAARVAYDEEPDMEHNSHYGDEGMIIGLDKKGKLGAKKRTAPPEVTQGDSKRTKDASKM